MYLRVSRFFGNWTIILALIFTLALYARYRHTIFIPRYNSPSETLAATQDPKAEIVLNISTEQSPTKPYWVVGTALEYYPLPIQNMKTFIKWQLASTDPWNADSKLIVNPAITSVTFANNTFTKSDCPDSRPLALLILIKSAAGNYEKRQVLRSTWANRSYLSCLEEPIEFAFLIGTGQFQSVGRTPKQLTKEAREHKDMVWIDYNETYRNNTYKTVAGMKWAVKHCPHFEFAVTVDDDMYLSVQNVLRFLRNPAVYPRVGSSGFGGTIQFSRFGFQIDPNELFYGGAVFGANVNLPNRGGWDKYEISFNEYPFTKFPEYASGAAVIYSRQAIKYLYAAAPFVKFLSLDDVYVGIVAAKLGIPLVDVTDWISCYCSWNRGCPTTVKTADCNQTVIAIHWDGMQESLSSFWSKYN